MAKVEAKMQSLGVEEASCCGKIFERGEQMSAVVSDSGEPLGWYCDQCIEDWKRKMININSALPTFKREGGI